MKRLLLLATVMLAAGMAAAGAPQRIVSLGLCTDQLLLQMVERRRIASLTSKSIDPLMSYMAEAVGDIPLNDARVEEIIPYRPDLIIGSAYSARDTVRMLKQLGYPVKTLPLPESVAEIYEMLRQVGEWLDESDKAEQMVRSMQQSLTDLRLRVADRPEKSVIVYSPNGYTIGDHTLENDVMRQAGLRNLSAEMGVRGFQKISLEQLIAADPDILLIDNHVYNRNSLAHQYINHPVLAKMLPREQQLFIPSRLRSCGGTMTVEAIAYLAEHR